MILTAMDGSPYDIVSAQGAAAVTPNDAADVPAPTKGLFLGATGNVRVDMANGNTVTFTALTGGIVHAIAVKRVYATGTTATGIIALY